MAETKEFNLEGDWNWNKIISNGDEWIESQAYGNKWVWPHHSFVVVNSPNQ